MTETPLWIRPAVSPGEREVSKCCDNCQSANNYIEGSISVGYIEKSSHGRDIWQESLRQSWTTHTPGIKNVGNQWILWNLLTKVTWKLVIHLIKGGSTEMEHGPQKDDAAMSKTASCSTWRWRKPHSNWTLEIEVRIIVCRNFASFEVLLCPSIVHGNFPRSAIVVKTSLSVWKGLLHRRFRSATRYWEKK